ncbi:HEPN domain-containing protein [Thioalkalivibrio sp. ALJ7]|uniref:HEPN domain-containing protein n=1 Tax=Thioalkalivibrio sp. ALJ7 TaxID=1158756 RepID=UPI000367EF1D|nr:HEPN domain-containing protein [Thioalkalivibrio sp. ALJ7]
MDVLLSHCNLELSVEAEELSQALEYINSLFLGAYLADASPSLAPFATSHSINDYSGINSRDSGSLRKDLPPDLQIGPSSDDIALEAWPVQLSLHCRTLPNALGITVNQFKLAGEKAKQWMALEARQPALNVVRDAALAAPLLPSLDQSLLHLWCALEALFPEVNSEVSFRLALHLAQLIGPPDEREAVFQRARKEYKIRSKVAHGSRRGIVQGDWERAWQLLLDAGNAIVDRGDLPAEDDLLSELLRSEGGQMFANKAIESTR